MLGIICGLLGLAAGSVLMLLFMRKQLTTVQEYNQAVIESNRQEEERQKQLQQQCRELTDVLHNLANDEQRYLGKLNGLTESIKIAEEQAQAAADTFYKTNMEFAQDHLSRSLEEEGAKYQQAIQDFQHELSIIQEEGAEQYVLSLNEKQLAISQAEATLIDLSNKVTAAVEASKRAEQMLTERDFYRIKLTEIDIEEIEKLRAVEPYLRDKEPLNKVIWKVYYEKPTNDLIGRVIGSGSHTGIYKITHIESQKCYVGQAANLADRWKQHIKRGVGADAPTRNKLYPAMKEFGPENFTFEVVEECDRSLLDSREDYWQDYFKAKEFGYSIK